jgi:hypothetical protein
MTEYFHGTDALLERGAVLLPPAELNPADPGAAKAHPTVDGTEGTEFTFATEYPVDARGWGANVYLVAPGGPVVPDWNGSEGDWAVRGRMTVLAAYPLPASVEARYAGAAA